MNLGYLQVIVRLAQNAVPVPNSRVYVKATGIAEDPNLPGSFVRQGEVSPANYDYLLITDVDGKTESISIKTPDSSISLNEFSNQLPYSVADVYVTSPEYIPVRVRGIQIFGGRESILPVNLAPTGTVNVAPGTESPIYIFDIPTNQLFFSIEQPTAVQARQPLVEPQVVDSVYIPEYITVHLGPPSSYAANVTVPFIDYIKNVASSEIYPTWPENSLRANIHAIVSLALNRVYTEWYPSQGYDFQITNSTAYDQAYVHGRNIFDNISQLVDEIFNVYVRRIGTISPYYTEYCDGRRVTCPGMSQWGTVSLAEQGYTPLQILQYYYGDDIELATTDDIRPLEYSYPGTPLAYGTESPDVVTIKRWLTRIRENYPALPAIFGLSEVFDSSTDAAVRSFQRIFNLTVDGIVGKATWYRMSYIYAAVTKLAELTGEGERPPFPVNPPDIILQYGDEGNPVMLLQYILAYISLFYPAIPTIGVDGRFGATTQNALIQFQLSFGLDPTGVTNTATWSKLYEVYNNILLNVVPRLPEQGYPGYPLSLGSGGEAVRLMQSYLNALSQYYPAIPAVTADGQFGAGTQAAVIAFQREFGLTPVDGIIGQDTWSRIALQYLYINSEAFTQAV